MKGLKLSEVEVISRRVEARREQKLGPRWETWFFPVKVNMKGAVVKVEKATSKKGKKFENVRHDGRSDMGAASNQSGWDSFGTKGLESSKENEPRTAQKVTNNFLVKELFKSNEEGFSVVGQFVNPNKVEQEFSSPLKPMKDKGHKDAAEVVLVGPSNGKGGVGKGNFKKFAREAGKAHSASMKT